eukprot:SAG31_NODE_123_length_23712_cov_41.426291_32_plen_128_part_00
MHGHPDRRRGIFPKETVELLPSPSGSAEADLMLPVVATSAAAMAQRLQDIKTSLANDGTTKHKAVSIKGARVGILFTLELFFFLLNIFRFVNGLQVLQNQLHQQKLNLSMRDQILLIIRKPRSCGRG